MLFLEKTFRCDEMNLGKYAEKKNDDNNKKTKLQTRTLLKRASTNTFKASLTVETACVVPVFLFAVLQILSLFDVFRMQVQTEAALHQTAREMAVYAHATGEMEGFSVLYAQTKVISYIGKEELEKMPISKGLGGLSLLNSHIMEKECIDLVATYQVSPVFSYMGFQNFMVANRCVVRAFTGYDNTGTQNLPPAEEELVYITEKGEVYHRDYHCSALSVSVRCVAYTNVQRERNLDGEKYRACPYCGKNPGGSVYITDYGNRYHSTILCHELKRCVMTVPISEVGGRRACMLCGGA